MRQITKTIYKFDELSDTAKERARQWYRNAGAGDTFFAESVFEDAATIADLFGLDIRTKRVTWMDGTVHYDPCIYYSGFSSQGDGACFEGDYKYKPGALKAVKDYAPKDAELHGIAARLQKIQAKHFYKLAASTQYSGHYYHSGYMDVSVWHSDDQYRDIGTAEEDIRDELRYFADWIYSQLESAYDWQNADEQVDENIIANEYEFDSEGRLHHDTI